MRPLLLPSCFDRRRLAPTLTTCLAIGLLLALSTTGARADHCASSPDPDLKLGFNGQAFLIHNSLEGIPNYTDRFIEEYQALGATSIRLGIDWQVVEKVEGSPDFDNSGGTAGWDYTDMVTRFHNAGIEVQGLFNTAPAWATQGDVPWSPDVRLDPSENNLDAMRETVRKMLVHFYLNGCITRWEFTNEPHRDVNDPEGHMGDPPTYAIWFAAFLDASLAAEQELADVHGHPVEFEIAMGAIDGVDIDSWANAVLSQPSLPMLDFAIDAIALHPYDRNGDVREGLNLTSLSNGLTAANTNGWEVWITEFGFNDPSGNLQRDFLCYALSHLDGIPAVHHANLHLLHDIDSPNNCSTGQDPNCYGLINRDFISPVVSDYNRSQDWKEQAWNLYRALAGLVNIGIPLDADGSSCAPLSPALLSPISEAVVTVPAADPQVTFRWQQGTDPLGSSGLTYQWNLWSCDANGCGQIVHASGDLAEVAGDVFSIEQGVACDTSYRWEVEARSAELGVPSRRSEAFFSTAPCGNLPPTEPSGLEPTDEAEVETDIDLMWLPSTDPDGDSNLVTYVISVLRGTQTLFSSSSLQATTVALQGLEPAEYVWQVSAKDALGAVSGTTQRRFRVRSSIPDDDRPDLDPTALRFDLNELFAGNSVLFDSTIKNRGSSDSPAFVAQWWLDGQQLAEGLHAGIPANDSMANDPSSELVWLATEGEHTLELRVDADNAVEESRENNNIQFRTFTVLADPRPDLKPTTIRFDRLQVMAGSPISFDSGVANRGNGDSGPFTVQWRVDGEDIGATGGHTGVPAGSTLLDGNSQLTWIAQEGTHRISFEVDLGNAVDEVKEANNRREVEVEVGSGLPVDLRAAAIRYDVGSAIPGQVLRFDGVVKNLGDVDAAAFEVQWLVDSQPQVTRPWPGLPAGERAEVPFYWTVRPGNHSITFVVDSSNAIAEVRENNNDRTVVLEAGGPLPEVDLSPMAIRYDAANLIEGQAVAFDSGVRNTGSGNSSSFNVRWLVDGAVVGYGGHAAVPAGSSTRDGNSLLVWTVQPGEHVLTFIVDADNHVAEDKENNNRKSITVRTSGVPRAELKPTPIHYERNHLFVGNSVRFDSGIENRGDADSGALNVRWLVDGVAVAEGGHPNVPANTSICDSNSFLDWTAEPGTHTIGFYVDSGNFVAEGNEGDNLRTIVVQVGGGPPVDLVATLPRPNPSSGVMAGQQVFFDAAVRNLGAGDSGLFDIEWRIDGVPVASGTHGNVPGGATVSNGNSQLTWTAVAGAHTVTFVVDSLGHISETKEQNNKKTAQILVGGGPQEPLTLAYAGPVTPFVGTDCNNPFNAPTSRNWHWRVVGVPAGYVPSGLYDGSGGIWLNTANNACVSPFRWPLVSIRDVDAAADGTYGWNMTHAAYPGNDPVAGRVYELILRDVGSSDELMVETIAVP